MMACQGSIQLRVRLSIYLDYSLSLSHPLATAHNPNHTLVFSQISVISLSKLLAHGTYKEEPQILQVQDPPSNPAATTPLL